jgi:hypothetical protein
MCWSRVSGWIQDAVQLIFKGQPLKIWKDMQKRVVNNPMPFLNFNEENSTNTVRLSFSWIRIYSSIINDSTVFAWNRSSMLTFKIDNFLKKTLLWLSDFLIQNCKLQFDGKNNALTNMTPTILRKVPDHHFSCQITKCIYQIQSFDMGSDCIADLSKHLAHTANEIFS